MIFIYNFGIILYGLIIRIASLGNEKAKKWVAGRKNWREAIQLDQNKRLIWFHFASLGEFDQGIPLIKLIKEKQKDVSIAVSFFSPSGMEHYQKRKAPIDFAFYLPEDRSSNMKDLFIKLQPEALFLVKYEFWHHLIETSSKSNVPVYSISTLLRPQHRFFKWWGSIFRKDLSKIDFFFVQNKETSILLNSIGLDNHLRVGDTRIDKVISNLKNASEDHRLKAFCADNEILILGSSWQFEEEILLRSQWHKSGQKTIIAPHDISPNNVKRIQSLFPDSERYSDSPIGNKILILDTIGHLSNAYQYGHFAFIGGGSTGKLHNILEPAVFGLPVVFGPKYDRFPEAKAFIESNIGFSIKSHQEFNETLDQIKKNQKEILSGLENYLNENQGASEKIYSKIYS